MRTLRQAGLMAIYDGITTIEEVVRKRSWRTKGAKRKMQHAKLKTMTRTTWRFCVLQRCALSCRTCRVL